LACFVVGAQVSVRKSIATGTSLSDQQVPTRQILEARAMEISTDLRTRLLFVRNS